MLVSKLVFLAIKDVLPLDDTGFNYETFKAGEFDNDSDYKTNINNVLSPLNEAIQRLSDLNRIPPKVADLGVLQSSKIDFSKMNISISYKDIEHFFQITESGYENISFTKLGSKIFLLTGPYYKQANVYAEYMEDIPFLDDVKSDIDLKEKYGITDGMCNYIIEYIKGKLLESIDPTQANLHVSRAEQYFNGLKANANVVHQKVVANKYGIDD